MRAEPNMPASRIKAQSQLIGLNWKMKLYESNPPTIMPLLAVWVLIFHLMLISAQMTMQSRVAVMMPPI